MKSIMSVLQASLPPGDYQRVARLVSELGGPAFQYSPKRREFTTTDGWFLLLAEADEGEADRECDRGSGTDMDIDTHSDSDLADLAVTCCCILNACAAETDASQCLEIEPELLAYRTSFTLSDGEAAQAFMRVLHENGYEAALLDDGGEARSVEVVFSAATDWEHAQERGNIATIYDMTLRHLSGKSPKGERL